MEEFIYLLYFSVCCVVPPACLPLAIDFDL